MVVARRRANKYLYFGLIILKKGVHSDQPKCTTITDDRQLFALLQSNGLELLTITANNILSIAVDISV